MGDSVLEERKILIPPFGTEELGVKSIKIGATMQRINAIRDRAPGWYQHRRFPVRSPACWEDCCLCSCSSVDGDRGIQPKH